MCLICAASNNWLYPNPANSIGPGVVEIQPYPETESQEFASQTGNAIFDVSWSSGEFFPGKTIGVAYQITDTDGFDLSSVDVTWHHYSGNNAAPAGDFIHEGSTYTLLNTDVSEYMVYKISYTDDAGNPEEYVGFAGESGAGGFIQTVKNAATETPNEVRTSIGYDTFASHISNNGMGSKLDQVKYLANTLQGKWGGDFGTAPASLTYSITAAGDLSYSNLQQLEHPLYADLTDFSTSSGSLAAIEFTADEKTAITDALDEWELLTGIDFVATPGDGLKADIVFTKLDFAAWESAVYTETVAGEVVPVNLEIYDLSSEDAVNITKDATYALHGNGVDTWSAREVEIDTDRKSVV